MKIFLTADTHFNHSKILEYCPNRSFSNINDMNETIIKNWNDQVSIGDIVYVLGDFGFGPDLLKIFKRLTGQKYLIKGNHDDKKVLSLPWGWIKDVYMLNHKYWLSHYPHLSWPKSAHGSLHFHGHCHGTLASFNPNAKDVGVDCYNLKLFQLE